jgi:polysaccharide biosynthesis transport protein
MLRAAGFVKSNPSIATSRRGVLPTGVDLSKIIGFVKASRRTIACWTILGLVFALVYAVTATPEYTAVANLMMDSRKLQVFKDDPVVDDGPATDAAEIESQVEIIRSKTIALAVVRKLKLTGDPEFVVEKPNFVMTLVRAALGLGALQNVKSEQEREREASSTLQSNLSVRRVGVTYVLEISYRAKSPDKAANIANSIAENYILNQLEVKYEATKRASVWLQDRIQELRTQSSVAAKAVEEYKAENNIVGTGNGGLLSERQLQELNSQLIIATAHTAEMSAKLERIKAVLASPAPDEALGTVSDTLTNPVILRLRNQFLDARKQEADISSRFGANHVSAVNLRNAMHELQHSIILELQRIADGYQSDYEIAKTREESIRSSLQELIKQADSSGQAQVSLSELESSANTYRTIFENFLQKFTEAVQQQSFPVSEAQVISQAEPPAGKSFPKTTLLLLLGVFVGGACGVAHAVVVRNLDRTVRTPREFEDTCNMDCLSLIPAIPVDSEAGTTDHFGSRSVDQTDAAEGTKRSTATLPKIVPLSMISSTVDASIRLIQSTGRLRRSVTAPLSRFTESLRAVKTSVDLVGLTRSLKVIGMMSALPNEGKSTVAANLAGLFAASGQKTLLIDCDLRNPSLSKGLAPQATRGLLEVLQGTAKVDDVLWSDPETGLKLLPAVVKRWVTNSSDLLGSARMKDTLSALSKEFDCIIVDLPPLGAVVDARTISPQIDGFVMVVEWGKTRLDVLEEALANLGSIEDRIIGGVLNKVDFKALSNIDRYSPGYYHNEMYGRYGH